jgi:hypothetical protein
MKRQGPTDNAIRVFKDSWDELNRYKKLHKRERAKAKEALKKLKQMDKEEIEEEE